MLGASGGDAAAAARPNRRRRAGVAARQLTLSPNPNPDPDPNPNPNRNPNPNPNPNLQAMQRGGDTNLYLISGLQILPKAYVGDGVHPTDLGQREIALNLDAEMGFAPVQVRTL